MHRLRSPYTVQFHEWFETSNHLWLILEYCPGGRLLDMIQVSTHPHTQIFAQIIQPLLSRCLGCARISLLAT